MPQKVLRNTFVFDRLTTGEGGEVRRLAFAGDVIPDTWRAKEGEEDALEPVGQGALDGQSVTVGYQPEQLRTTKEGQAMQKDIDAAREEHPPGYAPSTEEILAQAGGGKEAVEQHGSYNSLTVPQLREEVQSRDLDVPSDAKKADLVAALEEHDTEVVDEEPDDDDDEEVEQ